MSVIDTTRLDASPPGASALGGLLPDGFHAWFFGLLASMGPGPGSPPAGQAGAQAGDGDPDLTPSPAALSLVLDGDTGQAGRKGDGGSPVLPDLPILPGGPPASGQEAAAPDAGCYGFEGAGRVGGAVLGGTAEELRQAGPGALEGGIKGGLAGAGTGALLGAGLGAPVGGVGAVPGAGSLALAGAAWGTAAGAVVGGAPGFVRGVQDGAGPGAGAGIGRWLDGTPLGRMVQGCPTPGTVETSARPLNEGLSVTGPAGPTIMEMSKTPSPLKPYADDPGRLQGRVPADVEAEMDRVLGSVTEVSGHMAFF